MGLDGFVRCNCFPDQLSSPPPCPLEWLHWDDGYLSPKPEHDSDSLWHRIQQWAESACPHRSFKRISERVDNWTGVALFLEAIENHDFPNLKRLDGQLEWQQAAEALKEIERFRQLTSLAESTDLFQGDRLINSYVAHHDGVFLLDPKAQLNAGVDPQGFFLQCRQTGKEVFRALKFEHQGHTFRNLEDGSHYDTPLEFETGLMDVRTRASTPADFELTVQSLESLYKGSVEMRQPVHWI